MWGKLLEKLKESLQAAMPIGVIVLLLHFFVAPMPFYTLMLMLVGFVMLVLGLTLFSLGTDMAMLPMGQHIGSALLGSKNIVLLVVCLLLFGGLVTAAEPDLQVFAGQVASLPNLNLIIGISAGVGIFLVFAALRILFRWKLAPMLIVLYVTVFVFAAFSSDYLAVAFDASAITTGPVTVPFLLAIGAGFAAISSSKESGEDTFGICAVCSIGPILAVLLLGLFSDPSNDDYQMVVETAANGRQVAGIIARGLLHTLGEVLMVIIPILAIFIIFQIAHLRLSRTQLVKIFVGLGYLLVGLTVFLAGVNKGFMPAAKYLGEAMGKLENNWILIPLCLIIGACVVVAEPAVHVLTKQVEEITNGAITRAMMLFGMAAGVGIALALAMVRMLFGISIWWIFLPGFSLALLLTFFVPKFFVGIGFDSGGVAAGAMSAAFVLPFTIGVCTSLGGNVVTDAFGVVGMIAMMPPITVQLMGVVYQAKLRRAARAQALEMAADAQSTEEGTEA